jgi:transposase
MNKVTEKDDGSKEIFCGIDLHDQSLLAAIGLDKGAPYFRSYNTKDSEGVSDLISYLKLVQGQHPGSRIHAAYEASGCGFGLLDRLRSEGLRAEVLSPSDLPTSRKKRSEKTDRKDALIVLEALRSSVLAGSRLPTVWIPPKGLRDDRELVRRRLQLGEDLTRTKNRIHGFLKRRGHRRPEHLKTLWSKKYLWWLKGLVLQIGPGSALELGSLLRELEFRQGELAVVNRELERMSGREEYRVKAAALMELPGVGLVTAMVFLTELGDLRRFKNRRALANYLGLTPRSHESGKQDDRKGHISKMGPARVRKVLNQAAWCLVRLDPYWRNWYQGEGREHRNERKRRITAVMRRLGIIMWHTALEAELGDLAKVIYGG